MDEGKKRYCIRGKHVAVICAVVVVAAVSVGLGVGLTRPSDPAPCEDPSAPPPTPDPGARGPCLPSQDAGGGWSQFRLPDHVRPTHYDLHLEPDLLADTYTGSVSVRLEVSRPTRHLWLHIRETFVRAPPRLQRWKGQTRADVALRGCFEYRPHQYVVVEAATELAPTGLDEAYVLTLDFQGWLNGSLVGFYRTTYMENGELK